jgi:aminopeptidase N
MRIDRCFPFPAPRRTITTLMKSVALACTAGLAFHPAAHASGDLRLGSTVVPTAESLRLVTDANHTDYTGTARIELEVRERTSAFRLHAEEMNLDSVTLQPAASSSTIPITTAPGELGLVTFTSATPLAPGRYTLTIEFSNDFGTKAVGLYRMEQEGQGYVFTQFEADDAREAFPCFDEPGFKIPWDVTLVVPEGQLAVFNTPVAKETTQDGQRTVVFARTKPLPSYLLAIAVGPFETVDIPGLGVPGRVVTVRGTSALTSLAVETAPPLLHALEKWFDQKYPFEKLDLVAVPEYWPGAMENPGAITFAANILLVDPKAASIGQRRSLARVTAHELSHMWFGDLVTMAWWDDLWLNESFADWMGDKIADEVYPEYGLSMTELNAIQNVMVGDARPSAQAIRQPVEPGDDLMQNIGTQYNKGKAVLGMFEQWVGPENFRKGVLEYLRAHAWGNATADDLWAAITHVSGQNVTGAMTSFLEQPGVPLVSFEVSPVGGVRLTQQRLLNEGVEAPPLQWKIPVSMRYSDGRTTRTQTVLLTESSMSLELPAEGPISWVLPNADARGYYRWSVPPAMLARLTENPMQTMDTRERACFMSNLAALLDAGTVHGDDYLRALEHFADDPDPYVISAVANALEKVRIAFVPEELEDAFAVYIRRTLGPSLDRIGMEPAPGEPEGATLLRPMLLGRLGIDGGDDAVLTWAKKQAHAYLTDPAAVDPSLAGTVLQIAARDGDQALFDQYREHFESAQIPAERARFLSALAGFREPALMDAALDYALHGPLRTQELGRIAFGMLDTPAGRERAYRWMTTNYGTLTSRIPKEFTSFFPYFATGCELDRLESARTFFADPDRDSPSVRVTLAKVSDSVTDCTRLRQREEAAVAGYLNQPAGSRSRSGVSSTSR